VAFYDGKGPRVFAHRGGCALGPENTLAAFDLGVAAGADGLELDCHLSADGEVVVCHDATLDRTTDATGPVRSRTADELARVDAGWHFVDAQGNTPFRGRGIGIPRLADVLRRYHAVPTIIEMKVNTPALGRAVAEVVRAADAVDRVCAAGFGKLSTQAVRAALPDVATSASHPEVRIDLYASWFGWAYPFVSYGGFQLPERAGNLTVVSPRFIRLAHKRGLQVQVWTVDVATDMDRLLEWGVDALITNRPDLAVSRRNAFLSRDAATRASSSLAGVAAGEADTHERHSAHSGGHRWS